MEVTDPLHVQENDQISDATQTSKSNEVDSKKWWNVNTKYLPLKASFFTFSACGSALIVYLPIYLKQRGITPNEAGVIYGIIPFIGFLSQVAFSILADKVKKYRLMMILLLAVGLVVFMLLILMPQRPTNTKYVEASMFMHDNTTCLNISNETQHEKYDDSDVCAISILQLFHRFSGQQIHLNCQETCSLIYTANNKTFQYSENEHSDNNSFATSMVNVTFDGTRKVLSYGQEGQTFSMNRTCIQQRTNAMNFLISKHSNFSMYGVNFFCNLTCRNYKMGDCSLTEKSFDWIFGLFLLLLAVANGSTYPIGSLLDGATFRTLGKDKHLYGRQRVFAIFGITTMTLIFGLTMDASSTDQSHLDFDIVFYVSAGMAVLAMIAFTTLKVPPAIDVPTKRDSVVHLFCKMKSLSFLLTVFWCGITSGCLNFRFWFLKDIGSTQTTIAMCLVVRSVGGVVCLFLSGKIVDKIGNITCIYFALIGYVLRLTVISVVTNPWYVLPSETLSGVTEDLLWAASSMHASSMVKAHSAATIQGIVGGTYFGAGKGVGSLVTGFLFRYLGDRWTFRVFAIVCVPVLVVYVLYNVRSKDRNDNIDRRNNELSYKHCPSSIEEATINPI